MTPEIQSYEAYQLAYDNARKDPDSFWAAIADTYHWHRKWDSVQQGDFSGQVDIRWFEGAKTNLCENCLDRHLETHGDHPALIWEPNDPQAANRQLSFKELHAEVCRFANVLEGLGVQKGDRICLYMPMVPETAVAMLACARIGAIHSVVFAGFSANALADRIKDAECKLLITADSTYRGTKEVRLKDIADEALAHTPSIQQVIVYRNTGNDIGWDAQRDQWWHSLMADAASSHTPASMDAEDPLFILYTSGSTGQPKGILHTTAGYMVYVGYSFRNVFQIRPDDVYWCSADVGWITGHSYLVYGPLLNATTSLMFEGVPTWPDPGRFWDVIDKYRVSLFYTAPTAIRALQAYDDSYVTSHELSSLRVLGTVGEPINEEAWQWYKQKVGHGNCPIVDTWWQTENGGILISPLGGLWKEKPGFASYPLPGILPSLMDSEGKPASEANGEAEGNLCIDRPWPSIARTIYGDHERYQQTYFSTYPGHYFTGDGARRDAEGMYRITGRVDDVVNVSGHRIGTAEVENVIDEIDKVVESAVVGFPHEIKGQGIFAYVICEGDNSNAEALKQQIDQRVKTAIGSFAKPERVQVVSGLPKTRSGKIMRRILRKIAEGKPEELGDTSTLLDPEVVEEIKSGEKLAS